MIPPVLPISISGESGKRIGLSRVLLQSIGVDSAEMIYRSLGTDSVTWSQFANLSETVPEENQQISLWDATGRRIFSGRVKTRFIWSRTGGQNQVTASGPYEFLEKAQVLAPVEGETGVSIRPLKVFPPQSVDLSIRELIQMMIDQGAEFQLGEVSESFPVVRMTFKNYTYHDALIDMTRWFTDGMTQMDYSTPGLPTLNVIRRNDARNITFQLVPESNRVTAIDMESMPDLIPSSVSVKYVNRDALTFKPDYVTEVAGVVAGPSYKQQTFVASGPENSQTPIEDYENFPIQTTTLANLTTFIRTHDTGLKAILDEFGSVPGAPTAGFDLWSGFTHSASTYTPVILPPTKWMNSAGGTVTPYGFPITTEEPPEWAQIQYNFQKVTITGSWGEYWTYPNGAATVPTPAWLAMAQTQAGREYWAFEYINSGSPTTRAIVGWRAFTVTAWISPVAYASPQVLWRAQDFDFLTPPAGLAGNLFNAQQWLPYQGSIQFAPGSVEVAIPGESASIIGGPTEWRNARALVRSTRFNLKYGTAETEIGFPSRVSTDSLIGKFRQSVSDNIT